MKALFLAMLVAIFCLPGPLALADGFIPLLDAERISYDGEIVKIKQGDGPIRVTFKVNKTGEVITLIYDDTFSRFEGRGEMRFDDLKSGMRVFIQRYRGSKGAKYSKEEAFPGMPSRNTRNYDDRILILKTTSKPRPK